MEDIKHYLFVKYIEVHHYINHVLDIKNIIHFILGIFTGIFTTFVSINYGLGFSILVLASSSFLHWLFHKYFHEVPHTQVVLDTDDLKEDQDMDDEELSEMVNKAMRSAIQEIFEGEVSGSKDINDDEEVLYKVDDEDNN